MTDSERFGALATRLAEAICRGDTEQALACFAPEGSYHDRFYGEFRGRAAIADMITNHFHRDARDLAWRVYDPCATPGLGYARYDFSYVSKLAGSEGRRAGFSGIMCCRLRDGLIERYEEIFERGPVLVQLDFPDERVLKSLKRWA